MPAKISPLPFRASNLRRFAHASSFFRHSSFVICTALLPEHDDVLARQNLNRLRPLQRLDAHFLPHLRLGHLVHPLNRDLWALGAEFHEPYTSAGLQRLANRSR